MLQALKDQFASNMTQAEAIRLKYDGKGEEMSGQEETEYMRLVNEAFTIKPKIEAAENEAKLSAWAKQTATPMPHAVKAGAAVDAPAEAEQIKAAGLKSWNRFILGGQNALTAEDRMNIGKSSAVKDWQADSPAGGGFLIAPQDFNQNLITLVKDQVFMRQLGTNFTLLKAESLGFPALDTDPADADWTVELGTGSEENTAALGKRELRPHPLAKMVKISNKLLRNAVIDPAAVLQDRLAYKFAVTEEKAFLTGSGANQPLGVFTASNSGIPTGRDTTAANATSIVADDVMNLLYALKPQYQAKATFLMHRTVLLALRKLKDNNNNYIWASGFGPGLGYQGASAAILGRPYVQSEYAPSAITSGLYTLLVGDFSKYYIATALDMQLQVLSELFAATNQTGYVCRLEVDGQPILQEAFARLKQA